MESNSTVKIANRVSIITMLENIALAAFKLVAGITANSGAMVSDAVHSASDVLTTIAVMLGITAANEKSDVSHQYGHEKIECLFSLFVSISLLITGLGIGFAGIQKIFEGMNGEAKIPGKLALIAAGVSIIVKETMYWYTRATAKKINSSAMLADAWHHRSDALSSVGSLVGIMGARLGFPLMDPIAAVVISLLIIKVSIDIGKVAVSQLTDHSCPDKITQEIKKVALEVDGVWNVDRLTTRLFGSKFYVDIEISADGNLSLYASHKIAESVHSKIEECFPDAKHCMVHVNPFESNNSSRLKNQ